MADLEGLRRDLQAHKDAGWPVSEEGRKRGEALLKQSAEPQTRLVFGAQQAQQQNQPQEEQPSATEPVNPPPLEDYQPPQANR